MTPRILSRAAVLPLLGAALLSACVDGMPSAPAGAAGAGPRMTVIPTNAFATLDAGESQACALTSGGAAYCWGINSMGQLGDSTASPSAVPVAVHMPSATTFSQVTAGRFHNCALTSAGQAWCWGSNSDGRLGDSTTSLGLAPVAVKPLGGVAFASLHAGGEHTCGLDAAGQAYCWGGNAYGQLGDNTTGFQKTPVAVAQPSGVTFTGIHPGEKHTCALDTTGQAWCWGYGGDGAMGVGIVLGDSVPVAVTQPAGVAFASLVTEYRHTCGLTAAGQAYCWGVNANGQLGDNTLTRRGTPVAVVQPSGVTFAQLSVGWSHTCANTSGGQAYCWGLNGRGQLGDGSNLQRKTPVAVSQPGGVSFSLVSDGGYSTCGLDGVGQAWCWGRNDNHQLGDGGTTDSNVPVAVAH